MTTQAPAVFISHGAPDLAIRDIPANAALRALGEKLPRPEAIVIVSAHWETETVTINANPAPDTIYDFGGFDPQLRTITYSAPGSPETSAKVQKALAKHGISTKISHDQGFDHGVWVPLSLAYPVSTSSDRQPVSVTQISIQPNRTPHHHYQIGKALGALRNDKIMIIGSGALTHNVRAAMASTPDAKPPTWTVEFSNWIAGKISTRADDELMEFSTHAPHAAKNHPTPEHIFPIFIALGATNSSEPFHRIHKSYDRGVLAMDIYATTAV